MLDDVEAVVLVGGKGTRLRPLTLSAPKPMLPTAGVPFLAHLLSRIQAAGVRRVVLGTSYMAETFAKEFGDGEALGLELVYVVEDHPLGTGGGIRNAGTLSLSHVSVINNTALGSDGADGDAQTAAGDGKSAPKKLTAKNMRGTSAAAKKAPAKRASTSRARKPAGASTH